MQRKIERNLVYLTEFCQSRALGSAKEIQREHAARVFYLILWKYAKNSADPLNLMFRPQTVVFQWGEYVQILKDETNLNLTNVELTALFLSLSNFKAIEQDSNTISLIKPFPFLVNIEKIEIVNKEVGIELDSSIEIKLIGDLKPVDKIYSQTVSIAARKKLFVLLKKIKPRITQKTIEGCFTLFWMMNCDSSPVNSKQREFVFSKDELCSIFNIITINHAERKEPVFNFVKQFLTELDIGKVLIVQNELKVELSWKKFYDSIFFYNEKPVEKKLDSISKPQKLEDFSFFPHYSDHTKLNDLFQQVICLDLYDDSENPQALMLTNQFYHELCLFLNNYFSNIQKTCSPGFDTERIWNVLKEQDLNIADNSSIFSFGRKMYRKKGRLYQGKVDSTRKTTPLISMKKEIKDAFWACFGASTGYKITNCDQAAVHPNIGIGFQRGKGPLNWEDELANFMALFDVEIEREDFKRVILSTYNGKIWTQRNLAEEEFTSSTKKALLKYFEREKFPVFGVDFCKYSKTRNVFLGENFSALKIKQKSKANFILSTIECFLTTGLLLDLIANKNYVLSWEMDGLFFTDDLPNNLPNYNLVCEKLLHFKIPLKVVEVK